MNPRIKTDFLGPDIDVLRKLVAARGTMNAAKVVIDDKVNDEFGKYVNNPVGFCTEKLGGFIWSKQKDILNSIVHNRRTAVRSCHDVGKSAIAARAAAWWLTCHKPGEAFVVTSAPTWRQVKNILWREINRLHKRSGLPGRVNMTEWHIDNEIVAFGVSPADNDPTAFQGIHARYVLVIFDEACGIGKDLWNAADTLITNEDSRMLAIGNPDDPSTEFNEVCKPGSGWHVIEINAFDSPNFTNEPVPEWLRPLLISRTWVEEKRKKWGETSPLWFSKVLGQFPENADDGLISMRHLREAVIRELQPGSLIELGADIARFGQDSTVVYLRRGDVARRVAKHGKKDTMITVGTLVRLIEEHGPSRVKIDDSGVGGGVTDRLKEVKAERIVECEASSNERLLAIWRKVDIVPINVGEGSATTKEAERFINLRSELHWMMKERFTSGDIDIEDDDDVLSQATAIRYKLNSKGKIQIESKDDMRKRGLPSPDDFDALVLCFAKPAFPGSGFLDLYNQEIAQAEQAKRAA